jgi:hypothetical protein
MDKETVDRIERMKRESHRRMERMLQPDAEQVSEPVNAAVGEIAKKRAGYTRNKGGGLSKVRRKLVRASRRRNRLNRKK